MGKLCFYQNETWLAYNNSNLFRSVYINIQDTATRFLIRFYAAYMVSLLISIFISSVYRDAREKSYRCIELWNKLKKYISNLNVNMIISDEMIT